MPCHTCGSEYGMFKKELGCDLCRFSFCAKCCKKQEILTESGVLKKHLICNQCFSQKTKGKSSTTADISPPMAHKKRMMALKKQSYSVDCATHSYLESQWSDDKDKALAERLQKLKRDRIKDLPSQSELEERIAKLKGMDPAKYNAPPIEVFRPSDRRTSVEKAADLFKEMTDRVELEARIPKPEDEIAQRLARLRAMDSENLEKDDSSPKSDLATNKKAPDFKLDSVTPQMTEEEQIKFLIEKAKQNLPTHAEPVQDVEMREEDEAKMLVEKFMAGNFDEMEELDSLNDPESEKSPTDDQCGSTEEFPWCVICTEDAKIRCFGCEGDLYCSRCFRECHDSLDIKDHKTCPFLSPKKPTV